MNWREKVLDFDNIGNRGDELTGLVFDVQKFATHDGGGIRTLVFFKGCPLHCLWCSNPESLAVKPDIIFVPNNCIGCGVCRDVCPKNCIRQTAVDGNGLDFDRKNCTLCGRCAKLCYAGAINIIGRYLTIGELVRIVERDRKFYEESKGGVTFSGGEPTAQPEFLTAALQELRQRGIHTAIETSSLLPWESFAPILQHVDLVLCDLKHMDETEHRRLTGVSNQLILDNLRRIAGLSIQLRIRMPLIPGVNDDQENLRRTADFVAGLAIVQNIDLLPYHRLGEGKWRQLGREYGLSGLPPQTEGEVQAVVQYFSERGIAARVGG
ncbi:MAG: glycyl-radical enzyme activating protein [Desulfuromonadales bacterium]|nr:glycyl-radical enzyme activating protein [Desulfuromonadales bacterium]